MTQSPEDIAHSAVVFAALQFKAPRARNELTGAVSLASKSVPYQLTLKGWLTTKPGSLDARRLER